MRRRIAQQIELLFSFCLLPREAHACIVPLRDRAQQSLARTAGLVSAVPEHSKSSPDCPGDSYHDHQVLQSLCLARLNPVVASGRWRAHARFRHEQAY